MTAGQPAESKQVKSHKRENAETIRKMGCKWETRKALECPRKLGGGCQARTGAVDVGVERKIWKQDSSDTMLIGTSISQTFGRSPTLNNKEQTLQILKRGAGPIDKKLRSGYFLPEPLSPSPTSTLHVRAAVGDLSRRGFLCGVLLRSRGGEGALSSHARRGNSVDPRSAEGPSPWQVPGRTWQVFLRVWRDREWCLALTCTGLAGAVPELECCRRRGLDLRVHGQRRRLSPLVKSQSA